MILDVASDYDANVKNLMALKDDITFPGEEPLRDAKCVKRCAEAKNGSHEQEPADAAGSDGAYDSFEEGVMRGRNDAAHGEKEEESSPEGTPGRAGKTVPHGDDHGGGAQSHDR